MQAAVPAGLSTGDAFVAQLPDGQQIQMTVPPGATAGQQIRVVAPAPVQLSKLMPGPQNSHTGSGSGAQ